MADDGIEQLKKFDAIFLGAVGAPSVPDHISLWDLLLTIRKNFDQYINLRPVKLLNGAPNVLKDISPRDIDMIFVKENTEGEYAGSGSWLFKGKPNEVVIQDGVFSRKGCERVIRYAYELAKSQNKTLTSISKANALNYSMVFWDQIFGEVGREYPEVKTYSYLVDAASMFMVKDPKRFEIVVTSNLFGDILTDLVAAMHGGVGFNTLETGFLNKYNLSFKCRDTFRYSLHKIADEHVDIVLGNHPCQNDIQGKLQKVLAGESIVDAGEWKRFLIEIERKLDDRIANGF